MEATLRAQLPSRSPAPARLEVARLCEEVPVRIRGLREAFAPRVVAGQRKADAVPTHRDASRALGGGNKQKSTDHLRCRKNLIFNVF